MKRSLVVPFVALAAFVFAASAFAHAEVSPPIVPTSDSQVFTLAVPTDDRHQWPVESARHHRVDPLDLRNLRLVRARRADRLRRQDRA